MDESLLQMARTCDGKGPPESAPEWVHNEWHNYCKWLDEMYAREPEILRQAGEQLNLASAVQVELHFRGRGTWVAWLQRASAARPLLQRYERARVSAVRRAELLERQMDDMAGAVRYAIKDCERNGGRGFWQPCPECHKQTDKGEGYEYPISEVFQCHVGLGCANCGGIGVVWIRPGSPTHADPEGGAEHG